MEQKLIEKHTLTATGLTYEQGRILKQTMEIGEPRRHMHRASNFNDKCWPPRSASFAVAPAAETRSVAFDPQVMVQTDADEDWGLFAEEFKMSDDEYDEEFEGYCQEGDEDKSWDGFSNDTDDSFRVPVPTPRKSEEFKRPSTARDSIVSRSSSVNSESPKRSSAARNSTASKRPSTAATTATPRTSRVIHRGSGSAYNTLSSIGVSEAIDEFPIIAPSLLGELLKPEPSEASQISETADSVVGLSKAGEIGDHYDNENESFADAGDSESSFKQIQIQIQDVSVDGDSSITGDRSGGSSQAESCMDVASSYSSSTSLSLSSSEASSTSSGIKFKRNSKAVKEFDESSIHSELPIIERDYKKMYSNLVDPSTLNDSFLNLLPDDSNEDAVAETEMKIGIFHIFAKQKQKYNKEKLVLRELQIWAQTKFAPLFVNGLEGPQKFLKSFQLPTAKVPEQPSRQLNLRMSMAGKRLSNVSSASHAATSPSERVSQGYRNSMISSIDGEERSNKEFEELLQLTPWRPALEDSHRKEMGKGVKTETKAPKALVKRLKDIGTVEKEADIPVIQESVAELRAKSASKREAAAADAALAKREAAQKLLQKRSKYGTGWYLNPNRWESIIKEQEFVDVRRMRQKEIRDTLNGIIDRQRAIYG
ncbi:UNVERIFIED_CONTAM: hypothetical protein HDU68_002485 [Siphonaria sp. JEL0065]|nr:hypothetical protein HDU68_002485 [Siphonaria sp. JEL0065]